MVKTTKSKAEIDAQIETARALAGNCAGGTEELDALRKQLDAILEDLQVHKAELYSQNEELAAARDRAEAYLERFQVLFDRLPLGCLLVDQHRQTIRRANQTAATLFVVGAPAELENRSMMPLVTPGMLPVIKRHFMTAFESAQTISDEVVIKPKVGVPFPVQFTSQLVPDPDSAELLSLTTLFDLRERIEAEEALKQSEAHYRTLFEANPHGIQEIDTFGNIRSTNQALCRMLGYSNEELQMMNIADLLPEGERDKVKADIAKFAEEQPEPFPYYNKNIAKNGEVFDIEINWDYRRDEEGNVIGFLSVITNITEQKLIKSRLLESELGEHAAHEALDHIPFGIIIVDDNATVKFINQTAKEITEEKDGLLIRKNVVFTQRPTQRARLLEIIRNAIASARDNYVLPNEIVALTRSGGNEPLSVIVSSLWGNHLRFGLEKNDEPLAILFVTAPERQPEAPAETLKNLFGLTMAEANLTERLVAGMTLEEIATDLGITKHTVRKHLKSVFEKTGTNRQAHLIRLVMSTPIWFAAGRLG